MSSHNMDGSFDFNIMGQPPVELAGPGDMPSPQSPRQQEMSSRSNHGSSNVTVYQTTGPDAHTGPILAPGSATPALNPRSCVTCRRRKVRCDKQMPCSNCLRAQIPCVFPAPGRAPRQQRPKDPNAPAKNSSQREVELVKRLRKLEGIVEELSGQLEVESAGRLSAAGSPDALQSGSGGESFSGATHRHMSGSLDMYANSPKDSDSPGDQSGDPGKKDLQKHFGRLVLDDTKGSSRYVSSGFWSKLNDELDSIREETQRLTDDDPEDSDYEGTPPTDSPNSMGIASDHHGFILGYRSSDVNLQKCHPLPSHVTFMWSVYQENVEPLLKVLHIPSADIVLREARKNSDKLSPAHEALVFAIYLGAVTSLEPDEIETNFGANKDDLVHQYRFALEQSLAKANFLDSSDITVIQAFTIFLVVVRAYDESRFCWALTGLLIKMAQGLGYHRDGTNFNLSPFNTEMRRRLWWSILALDLRSAEELGTDMTVGEGACDTRMPSNINDADISPESTEMPEAREGRSDCAVAIVRHEITGLCRRIVNASSGLTSADTKISEGSIPEREAMLIEVYQRLEHKFLQHVVDETDPLYWVAAMVSRIVMAKMCLVIYQPMLFPGSEHELSGEIRQRIYIAAIEIVEYNHKLNTDSRCKQYRWLFMTYTNWHAIAYTLMETCRRPWTAIVERGWEAVNGYEQDPVDISRRADLAAVFLPLRKLFARARKHRESELTRLKANQEEARRLDFAERMNPEQARFGPVPGAENRMEEVREKWRALTRPDGASPMPFNTRQRTPQPPMTSQPNLAPPNAAHYGSLQPSPAPSHGAVPPPMDFSNATMEYMDGLMAQPNVTMAEFWPPMNNMAVADMPGHDHTATLEAQMAQQDALRQQALKLQTQLPKDDGSQPYIWSDPFTIMNTKFDDPTAGLEDTEMLGDDFDWQDWSQSIRGLEMESTQPQKQW